MNERFTIVENKCQISVLDTQFNDSDENRLLLYFDFEDNFECALYTIEQLKEIVRSLNIQERMIKEIGNLEEKINKLSTQKCMEILDCDNCDNLYTCDNNWSDDNPKECLKKLFL